LSWKIFLDSARVHELDNRIRIGVLIDGASHTYPQVAEKIKAYSVHQNFEMIDEHFVREAHQRGLNVFAYTVNNPEDIARMAMLGVDGVFTDYPDRVLSVRV
jgi:glycerophosphoryl diester phosphodiesterase